MVIIFLINSRFLIINNIRYFKERLAIKQKFICPKCNNFLFLSINYFIHQNFNLHIYYKKQVYTTNYLNINNNN